jgi:hypothetical protein
MHLAVERLRNSRRYAAVLYGPIVLSGALGSEGLTRLDFWQTGDTLGRKAMPESQVPAIVAASPEVLLDHLVPEPGKPLTFRTTGGIMKPAEVGLIPFYKNHYQRLAIYWRTMTAESYDRERVIQEAEARHLRDLDARSIDFVRIGDEASEAAHGFRGERTNTGPGAYGQRMESHWRDASPGGWFSYEMKVAPGGPNVLHALYWGRETGARTFEVQVRGRTIAKTTLGDHGSDDFYAVETPIPEELTRGQAAVTIRFQAHPGNMAGGLFDLRILPGR